MSALSSFFSQHLGSKLIATLLALVVYAHVYTEREQSAEFDAPLTLTGLGPQLLLRSSPPENVRVRIRAKGKQIWKLRMRPPELVVDLGGMRSGEVQRMLSPADVALPLGSEAVVQSIAEPRMLLLDIDSLITRVLPVELRLSGKLPEDAAWDEGWSAEPGSVSVSGPGRSVAALTEMPTQSLPLGAIRESTLRRLPLLPADDDLHVRPESVNVRLSVVPLVRRSLGRVAVRIQRPRGSWQVRVMPDSATVMVSGPQALVEALDPRDVEVSLDTRGLGPGLHRVAPRFSLPHEKLEVAALMPSEFLVEVTPPAP